MKAVEAKRTAALAVVASRPGHRFPQPDGRIQALLRTPSPSWSGYRAADAVPRHPAPGGALRSPCDRVRCGLRENEPSSLVQRGAPNSRLVRDQMLTVGRKRYAPRIGRYSRMRMPASTVETVPREPDCSQPVLARKRLAVSCSLATIRTSSLAPCRRRDGDLRRTRVRGHRGPTASGLAHAPSTGSSRLGRSCAPVRQEQPRVLGAVTSGGAAARSRNATDSGAAAAKRRRRLLLWRIAASLPASPRPRHSVQAPESGSTLPGLVAAWGCRHSAEPCRPSPNHYSASTRCPPPLLPPRPVR